ncbi:acyltransferase family protein [Ramlibacter sp. AN1133]|uniref:acyltransferase family protein n=1 Tax=Ramlibacter sp. AN1133 TaxID=3133429 RepID=UPI0030BF4CBA
MQKQSAARASEVDLFRFLAALAVVFFHYAYMGANESGASTAYPALGTVAQYGYLGVDLFFLISGFVIMMSASHGTVAGFVASRAARLFPAFGVCCTATFLVLLATGQSLPSVTMFLLNMTLAGAAAPITLVDPSYWSLAAEIRFYALVALLLWFRQMRRVEAMLGVWLAVSVAMAVHNVRLIEIVLVTRYAAYFVGGAGALLHLAGGPLGAARADAVRVLRAGGVPRHGVGCHAAGA